MTHSDPYRDGFLAAMSGKSRKTPGHLTHPQRTSWLKGYDKAWNQKPEERKRPGRPSMTR